MCSQPHINYLYINLYIYLYIFKYILYIFFFSSVARNVLPPSPKIFLSVPSFSLLLLLFQLSDVTPREKREKANERSKQEDCVSLELSVHSTTLSSLSYLYEVPPWCISPRVHLQLFFCLHFRFLPNMASSRIRCMQHRRPFRRQTLVPGRCRSIFRKLRV